MMPLQWKIYYWCSIYLVVWCKVISVMIIYSFVAPGVKISNPYFTIPAAIFIICCFGGTAFYAFRFYSYLKNESFYTEQERKRFAVLNSFTGVLCAICLIAIIYAISAFFNPVYLSFMQKASNYSLLVTVLCGGYVTVMYYPLIKAINENYSLKLGTPEQDTER